MEAELLTSDQAGLTSQEAAARLRRGEGNTPVTGTSRSYASIIRTNVFSFFNVVLFVIGVALLLLGRYNDAFISVGLGVVNALIGAFQEIRAKRKLESLQLLDKASVTVVREGAPRAVAPEHVVRGDLIRVGAGEQIVVDGPVVRGGPLEVDESLLTGESDPIMKRVADRLLSGSIVTTGEAEMVAGEVGAASYAGRLTADARRHSTDTTPLQAKVAFVVRLVILVTVLISGAILAQALLEGFTLVRTVQITAVLSGLVPYGLFTLIAVAYAAGAVRISRRGALIQQVNAVESVSNVDVVCTDKTGTLTTGRLTVDSVLPMGEHSPTEASTALARFAASVTTPNLTTSSLAAAFPSEGWPVRDEVPFTSSSRWSGFQTDEECWVLGAPDTLTSRIEAEAEAVAQAVSDLAGRGLRVLLLATADHSVLRTREGAPSLPPLLRPVALVALADELRPDAATAIERFLADGVAVKIISGDDPRTVAALARRAGLASDEPVRGSVVDELDGPALDQLVSRTSVFGRVSPQQKEKIVASLRRQNRYVAMIGDGLNDARALKAAQVGVAMRSGSSVTRDVADIVLTDDSIAALLPAQREGRTIVNGVAVSMSVFLVRILTQVLVIITITMLGLGFPYSPTQMGLTLFTVGLPTLFLTVWAPDTKPQPHLLASMARFVVPASLVTAGIAVAIYAFLYTRLFAGFTANAGVYDAIAQEFERYTDLSYTDAGFAEAAATIGAQTGLTTFISFASVLMILLIVPSHPWLAAWTPAVRDWRPPVLVVVLIAALVAVFYIPVLSDYFDLTGPAGAVYDLVLPALAAWFVVLYVVLRLQVLDKILGYDQLTTT